MTPGFLARVRAYLQHFFNAGPTREKQVTDQELQKAIDAKPFEKVTEEGIKKRIAAIAYFVLPGTTVTICSITMENGYSFRGESACVDSRNFDPEIGEALAFKDAFRQIWAFEGYLLAERRHRTFDRAPSTARTAHEVNRAYCAAIGDNSQPAWEDAPQWQKESAIAGVHAHMSSDLTPEQSHEAWLAHKAADGWKWGPVKDVEKKEHPCFMPYADLPQEQKVKDYLFRAVVRAAQ